MEVRYRAPAKINWTLAVKRRRPDGYHEIDTVLQAVSLYDELIVVSRRKPICLILDDEAGVPKGRANLIYQAWRLLREKYPQRVGGIAVDLEKAIPMGAGLGGGSADAAATLMAVGKLFGLGLEPRQLERLAAELGSDVPFFIRGGAARARGRGERIERIASRLPATHLVIVWPGFASPTPAAYDALTPEDFTKRSTAPAAVRALTAGKRKALSAAMKNTFDAPLRRIEPRYAAAFEAMERAGLSGVMLAGSGASLFAVARNRAHAMKAQAQLQAEYPWTYAVRTIRNGVHRTD
jgi:4-diphosphocytidyl-2-C-methyl-D-erythritol kinase